MREMKSKYKFKKKRDTKNSEFQSKACFVFFKWVMMSTEFQGIYIPWDIFK